MRKGIILVIIGLFIGASVIPAISININQYQLTEYIKLNKINTLDLNNGLVSYWSFNEGSGGIAYDSAGNNDATIYGATWTDGFSSKALCFDGIDDYLKANDPFTEDTSFTISVWFKAYDLSVRRTIITTASKPYDLFDFEIKFNPIHFGGDFIEFNKRTTTGDSDTDVVLSNKIETNIWYHLVAVYNSSIGGSPLGKGALKLYINSNLQDDTPKDCNIKTDNNWNFLTIGITDRGYPFDGIIDEIKIYNRVLNADEIMNQYNEYTDGCTHTVGYWKDHADPEKHGGKHYDPAWDELPNGPATQFFDTGYTYLEMLRTPAKGGNAYLILAHQYIAAELNGYYNDPVPLPSDIQDIMNDAATILDNYDTNYDAKTGMPTIPRGDDRTEAINIANTLDDFNNGYLYWPHCDDSNIRNKMNNIQLFLQRLIQRFSLFTKILNQII